MSNTFEIYNVLKMNYCIFCIIKRGISNISLDWIKSKQASHFTCFVVLQKNEQYKEYWSLLPNVFQNRVYWRLASPVLYW